MISLIVVFFFTVSTVVSIALISACILSGRSQAETRCTGSAVMPAIAEMQLPKRVVKTPLPSQQASFSS